MIKSFRYKGNLYTLVSNEEMNHYANSDKNIFLLGDIFTETSVRNNAENDIEEFLKMGIFMKPKTGRLDDLISRMHGYRAFYDRVYSQDVKNFYCFVEN